jgi:hypothetical protein
LTSCGTKGLVEIDPATFKTRPLAGRVTDTGFETTLDFADSQSYVFLESERNDAAEPIKAAERTISLPRSFTLCERPRNALTIDRFAATREGEGFRAEQPIEQIRDELRYDRYAGRLTMTATVTIDELPATLMLATELPAGHTVTVNGNAIKTAVCRGFEKDLTVANILPLIQVGQNSITYEIDYRQREEVYHALYEASSESLRNCLSFDSEIECMYLFGDFTVKTTGVWDILSPVARRYHGTFSLGAPEASIDLSGIEQSGYPFFAGSIKAETQLSYHAGEPTVLRINGRYATCGVAVNGQPVTTLLFEHDVDLAPYLIEGENTICLTLTNSCRNLLGPHHTHDPEPFGVGPFTFSFERQWHNGICEAFVPAYAFVRFGLDLE